MNTIKLKNPIMINNKLVSEMTYDANEIDGNLFAMAETKKKMASGNNATISIVAEGDFTLHLYLGYAAIIAINPEYDWADLARIKGTDVKTVMGIGRNFTLGVLEEDLTENGSEKLTETLQESTTQASQNYLKKD